MSKIKITHDDDGDESEFVMSARAEVSPVSAPAKTTKPTPAKAVSKTPAVVAADELPSDLPAAFAALRSAQIAYDGAPPATRLIALAHLAKIKRHCYAIQQVPASPDAVSADVKASQIQPVDASGVLAEIKNLRR